MPTSVNAGRRNAVADHRAIVAGVAAALAMVGLACGWEWQWGAHVRRTIRRRIPTVARGAPNRAAAEVRREPPAWLCRWWYQAGCAGSLRQALRWWFAAMVGGTAVLLATARGVPASLWFVACAVAPAAAAWALRDRRQAMVERALPHFLDAIARSLRADLSLPVAFASAAADAGPPLAHDLDPVVEAYERGTPFAVALGRWCPIDAASSKATTSGLVLASSALRLAADAGGARAQAVDNVAATLRERQAVSREAHALATQARLSALVIVVAPVGFSVFVAGADPQALGFLFGTPIGWLCIGTGTVLDLAGAVWMHHLARGVVA